MKFDLSNIRIFLWAALYYEKLENEIGIVAFNLLNTNQEAALKQAKEEFNEAVKNDADLKDMEDHERGNYYMYFYEREELAIRELQRRQRYSILLSLYSYFEGRMRAICLKIEEEFKFKIKVDDLSGSEDLMRYWNYLEKVYEMDMKSLEPFFTPVKQNKLVRNIIAHQNGYARLEQKNKIEQTKEISCKEIDPNNFQIHINDTAYITGILEKMEKFLEEMLLSIDRKYAEKKTKR